MHYSNMYAKSNSVHPNQTSGVRRGLGFHHPKGRKNRKGGEKEAIRGNGKKKERKEK